MDEYTYDEELKLSADRDMFDKCCSDDAFYLAISRSILVASCEEPPPKPMSLKERIWLYLVVCLFLLLNIAVIICAMIAFGVLDTDFLF